MLCEFCLVQSRKAETDCEEVSNPQFVQNQINSSNIWLLTRLDIQQISLIYRKVLRSSVNLLRPCHVEVAFEYNDSIIAVEHMRSGLGKIRFEIFLILTQRRLREIYKANGGGVGWRVAG